MKLFGSDRIARTIFEIPYTMRNNSGYSFTIYGLKSPNSKRVIPVHVFPVPTELDQRFSTLTEARNAVKQVSNTLPDTLGYRICYHPTDASDPYLLTAPTRISEESGQVPSSHPPLQTDSLASLILFALISNGALAEETFMQDPEVEPRGLRFAIVGLLNRGYVTFDPKEKKLHVTRRGIMATQDMQLANDTTRTRSVG